MPVTQTSGKRIPGRGIAGAKVLGQEHVRKKEQEVSWGLERSENEK